MKLAVQPCLICRGRGFIITTTFGDPFPSSVVSTAKPCSACQCSGNTSKKSPKPSSSEARTGGLFS